MAVKSGEYGILSAVELGSKVIFMANGAASAYMFDTHAFVKRLTGAGLSVEAAETLATEQSHLIENMSARVANAASKDELKAHVSANKTEFEHAEVRIDSKFDLLRKDNELLRKDMDAKFEFLRKDMIIQLGKMIVGAIAIIIGAIKYLP